VVIFTIHQPSSDIFEMFDRYMVLSKGKFIYQGPGKETVDYFTSIGYQCPDYSNPADYIMDIAHSYSPDAPKLDQLFLMYDQKLKPVADQEIIHGEVSIIKETQKESRFWYEMKEVSRRGALNFRRNPILFKSRVAQTVFMAFLVCSLYFQLDGNVQNPRSVYNREGGLFFLTVSQFMGSLLSVLLTFPAERAVFLKEQNANMYSVSAYFFGRSATELPFITVFPFIFSCIVYWICAFNNENPAKFFIFALFMVLQSVAGNAIGLMAGCLFNDPRVATGVAPMAMMPLMVFSGFYINTGQMPVWLAWIKYISPFFYSLQGLIRNEFYDSAFGSAPIVLLGFEISIGMCILYHIIIGLGFRTMALINLKLLVRRLQ